MNNLNNYYSHSSSSSSINNINNNAINVDIENVDDDDHTDLQQSTLTITPADTTIVAAAAVVLDRGVLMEPKSKRSDTWKDIKIYSKDQTMANCIHCKENVSIGKQNNILILFRI